VNDWLVETMEVGKPMGHTIDDVGVRGY